MSRVDIPPAKGEIVCEVFLSLPCPGQASFPSVPLCFWSCRKATGLESPCGLPGEHHNCKGEAPREGGGPQEEESPPSRASPTPAPALGLLASEAQPRFPALSEFAHEFQGHRKRLFGKKR